MYTGKRAEKALEVTRELGQCLNILYQVRDIVSERMAEVCEARDVSVGEMDADFNDHLFKCIGTIKTIISDNIENEACNIVDDYLINK